ncbi:hypothetical protein V8D89_008866 [Ganoderma adspersum]
MQVTEETGPYALDPDLALISGTEVACAISNEFCDRVTFVGRAAASTGPTLAACELGDDAFAVTFKTRAALQRVLDALEWRPAELLRGVPFVLTDDDDDDDDYDCNLFVRYLLLLLCLCLSLLLAWTNNRSQRD